MTSPIGRRASTFFRYWEWQYLYGDACAADLLAAGFWDPATYDWHTTVDNPEVPLYMVEKAATCSRLRARSPRSCR